MPRVATKESRWRGSAFAFAIFVLPMVLSPWTELGRRTWREVVDDDVLGLAAQLSYYFVLALFPAILLLLALASFFPLSNMTDDVARSLGPFVSSQVLTLIQEQMQRLANNENGGLLTFGVAGALWSSSAALVSIVGALNRGYDIDEGRPWWKLRLVAIGLTRCGTGRPGRPVASPRRADARRDAGTYHWLGGTLRMDVAGAASILVGVVLTVGGALCAGYFVSAIGQTEIGLKETREPPRDRRMAETADRHLKYATEARPNVVIQEEARAGFVHRGR